MFISSTEVQSRQVELRFKEVYLQDMRLSQSWSMTRLKTDGGQEINSSKQDHRLDMIS